MGEVVQREESWGVFTSENSDLGAISELLTSLYPPWCPALSQQSGGLVDRWTCHLPATRRHVSLEEIAR